LNNESSRTTILVVVVVKAAKTLILNSITRSFHEATATNKEKEEHYNQQ